MTELTTGPASSPAPKGTYPLHSPLKRRPTPRRHSGCALAAAHNLQVSGHCAPNLHARAGVAVPNLRHVEYFHDHQRIERLLFDGALDPDGGILTPDPDQPGLGLTLWDADAERYRRS